MAQLEDLQDKENMARVGAAITKAVTLSFHVDEIGGTQTSDEVKRRTRICLEHYKIMRNDLGWSISKICDQMPRALVAELSGVGVAFLEDMNKRGWIHAEKRTPSGLIIP